MSILHLCVNYNEKLFFTLFSHLSSKIDKQFVFFPRRKHLNPQKSNYKGIEQYSPIILNKLTRLCYIYKMFKMFRCFKNFYVNNNYSLVHAHTLFSDGGLAYLIKRKYGVKYVVTFRMSDVYFLRMKKWLKIYIKIVLKNAEHIFVLSPTLKKIFLREFGEQFLHKITINPNGVDKKFLRETELNPKRSVNMSNIKLLYVGKFIKRKNIDKLLEFVIHKDNLNLTIIGDGGKLKKKVVNAHNLYNKINYLGKIDNLEEIIDQYQKCDIFIMVSKNETFGRVYIEAISQGVPIIYLKDDGIDGFFDPGEVGFPVSLKLFDEWNTAINLIIEDYNEISMRAFESSKAFSWENIKTDYLKVYYTLINENDFKYIN